MQLYGMYVYVIRYGSESTSHDERIAHGQVVTVLVLPCVEAAARAKTNQQIPRCCSKQVPGLPA